MNVYGYRDYKPLLRDRVQGKRRSCPGFTFARLAEKLTIQATYLSRVLNDEKAHFSEDQLYRIVRLLDFTVEEREFVMLLRAAQATALPERREELVQRIEATAARRGADEVDALKVELSRVAEALDQYYRRRGSPDLRVLRT